MDRGLARWLLFGLAIALLFIFFKPFGKGDDEPQPLKLEQPHARLPAEPRPPEQLCDLWHPDYHAQISTRGATLKHFFLLTAKYQRKCQPFDLSTTPDHELYRQLRFRYRNEAAGALDDKNWQIDFDSVDFKIERSDGNSCELGYRDQ